MTRPESEGKAANEYLAYVEAPSGQMEKHPGGPPHGTNVEETIGSDSPWTNWSQGPNGGITVPTLGFEPAPFKIPALRAAPSQQINFS